jgi:hypothetical protein
MIGGLLLFGMKGLLAGVVIHTWFAYFINISLVSKYIGYKWSEQLLNIMPVAIASVVSAAAAFGVSHLLNLSLYPDGILKAGVCFLIYLAWSFIFKPEAYKYFKSIIMPMVAKLKHKPTK